MPSPRTAAPVDFPRSRERFPVFRKSIDLNSCSLGLLSLRSRAAIGRYLDPWDKRGPRVVTPALDFPTVACQWLARAAEGAK